METKCVINIPVVKTKCTIDFNTFRGQNEHKLKFSIGLKWPRDLPRENKNKKKQPIAI